MRILIINYRFFECGGPERYLFGIKRLFENSGHEVIPFSSHFSQNIYNEWQDYFVSPIGGQDEITFQDQSWTLSSLVKSMSRSVYSVEVYKKLKKLIEDSRPDVIYALLFLRKLSPSVILAAKEAGLPFIARLSDFSLLCPSRFFLRDNQICELCKFGNLWPSVRYRCIYGSYLASTLNALATLYHRWRGYFKLIDSFVCPTLFLKKKMIESGWPPEKLHHLPTLVDLDFFKPQSSGRQEVISYVGRIDPAKGLKVLVDAFALLKRKDQWANLELRIAGDLGTQEASDIVRYAMDKGLRRDSFIGSLDRRGVADLLSNSLLSVVPSLWYDNMPNAVLESLACGTPVVGSEIGSLRELLGGGNVGALFKPGDANDLAEKISALVSDADKRQSMSKQARIKVEQEHSGALHLDRLLAVFQRNIDEHLA